MQPKLRGGGAGESLARSPAIVSTVFGPAETFTYSDRWNGPEGSRNQRGRQDAERVPA